MVAPTGPSREEISIVAHELELVTKYGHLMGMTPTQIEAFKFVACVLGWVLGKVSTGPPRLEPECVQAMEDMDRAASRG